MRPFRRYAMLFMAVSSPLIALFTFFLLFSTRHLIYLTISIIFTVNTTLFSYHHFLAKLGITKKIGVVLMHVISPTLSIVAAYAYWVNHTWEYLLIPVLFALMPVIIFFVGLS
ncbi:hypothetical protein [Sulfobacillus thermosulfidooxidans]|uniref:hypothetical protein n=1 Tax=Sulfobacillus thermosulfidooxidans TaxID=28034 RepID=UPI0006B64091|nr:hypothetical protein [Sulfobacillus thermosulfidooxidans]